MTARATQVISRSGVVLLLPIAAACQVISQNLPTPSPQRTEPSVTVLETPQPVPVSQLETAQADLSATTQMESSSSKATTTVVEKAFSDLKAAKTSEGIRINLPDNILFDFDKYTIRATAKPTLAKINTLLRHYQNAPVSVYGHTDSKGSDAYNQKLSDNRATAVKNYFVKEFGIPTDRLAAKGFGETQPVAPNTQPNGADNPEGRQKNRRVEVMIHNTGA